MTETQNKAIASLERAFKKCAKEHVAFYAMDSTFYAVDAFTIVNLEGSPFEILKKILDEKPRAIKKVNTKGSYIDSGGW